MSNRTRRPDLPRWRPGSVDLSRRRSLIALTATGASIVSTAAMGQSRRCARTEDAGEGPFYFDPELVRSNISDDSAGLPLEIAIQITRASDCAILAAARVDLWHADGLGLYSGYANQPGVGGITTRAAIDQTWLRGTQFTDGDGWVRFRTIYPSWYGGRTPHLHFKVWLDLEEVIASQIFLPDETSKFVFDNFEPYRTHIEKRTVFNDNDPLQQGVYCDVASQSEAGVSANAVVAVVENA